MSSSQTYNFNPSFGDFVVNAYAKCGVRRTELTAQHLADARTEANFMMADWSGDGINLWQVERATIDLVKGQISYSIPKTTIFLLDVWITYTGVDRILTPISRSDYAAIPNKRNQGQPTSYWYDRTEEPALYLWPLSPADYPGGLAYYYMKQSQDINLQNGTQLEMPWNYFDSFVWGLAARLSYIYAPDRTQLLEAKAQVSRTKAFQSGTENVPITMNPALGSYFR